MRKLDDLIDDVARQMTAVDPSADLGARIASRLESSSRSRWTWMAVPGLAAAVVVIGLMVLARQPTRPAPTAAGAGLAVLKPPSVTQSPTVRRLSLARGTRPVDATPRRGALVQDESSAGSQPGRERVESSLTPPDPLTVPAIEPDVIDLLRIAVDPIEAGPPLSVAPLRPIGPMSSTGSSGGTIR